MCSGSGWEMLDVCIPWEVLPIKFLGNTRFSLGIWVSYVAVSLVVSCDCHAWLPSLLTIMGQILGHLKISLTIQEHHYRFGSMMYRLKIPWLPRCLWGCSGWWSRANLGALTCFPRLWKKRTWKYLYHLITQGCSLTYLLTCCLLPTSNEMPGFS